MTTKAKLADIFFHNYFIVDGHKLRCIEFYLALIFEKDFFSILIAFIKDKYAFEYSSKNQASIKHTFEMCEIGDLL